MHTQAAASPIAAEASDSGRSPGFERDDEQFVIVAVAAAFSAPWRPGEDPPDAYLILGAATVAVENLDPYAARQDPFSVRPSTRSSGRRRVSQ